LSNQMTRLKACELKFWGNFSESSDGDADLRQILVCIEMILSVALSQAFPPPEAANLRRFAAQRVKPAGEQLGRCLWCHWLLFSCPTPHDRRAGPAVNAPRRSGDSTPHPAGANMPQDATFAGCGPEFAASCFRRKLMCSIKLRLFLSGLGWTATLDITLF